MLEGLELRPLGSAGNSPASPLSQPGYWQFDTPIRLWCGNGNGIHGNADYGTALTERQYGNSYGNGYRWTET